tara:strand:- start:847 stop:2718 length:1872 start_codon:yes stop_codon:yes gene_type:complete
MAKLIVEVKLKDGIDESSFISEFNDIDEVSVKNTIPDIPTLLVMYVEDSYLSTFQSHSSLVHAENMPPAYPAITYPSIPSKFTLSNKKVSDYPGSNNNGTDYIPYQFYLDTDIMQKPNGKVGNVNPAYSRSNYDDVDELSNQDYSSNFTGKYVDIITIEASDNFTSNAGVQDTHPDFDDPDNTGNTRCVPTDWYGCEGSRNNQVASNSMLSDHGMGVLSAAGGVNCGFAKKSKLYGTYLGTDGDSLTEICEAIIYFHNNKSNNPTTGIKDPTIAIGEFQYLVDTNTGIKVDDIETIVDPTNGTSTKPFGGWGSDLTPFTSRNIFPYRAQDPNDDSWHWMVTFPLQFLSSSTKSALDSLHDNGIVFINAAGNNGGTYVKENDARWSGTYCTITGTVDTYNFVYNNTTSKGTTSTTNWYPFRSYGPHGLVKSIDVAAGQNSETYPMLDDYTTRGPGIDVVGLGRDTFTAYPSSTMSDGNKWGDFSGTSCATPTVVGKAACLMEKYYVLNGAWPTPSQVKTILVTESKNGNKRLLDPASTTWSNVPNASSSSITIDQQKSGFFAGSLIRLTKNPSLNGGASFAELAGTPPFRVFLNTDVHTKEQARGQRPTSGVIFPRPRNISNIG